MSVEQMFEQLMKEFKGVKEEVKGVKEEVSGIKEEVNGLKKEVSVMKEDLIIVKSQLDENTQLTKAIHHRQEITDTKLENLSDDVHKLQGELSSLKEGQVRQDKILESLAMRSLEQETELRALKRI